MKKHKLEKLPLFRFMCSCLKVSNFLVLFNLTGLLPTTTAMYVNPSHQHNDNWFVMPGESDFEKRFNGMDRLFDEEFRHKSTTNPRHGENESPVVTTSASVINAPKLKIDGDQRRTIIGNTINSLIPPFFRMILSPNSMTDKETLSQAEDDLQKQLITAGTGILSPNSKFTHKSTTNPRQGKKIIENAVMTSVFGMLLQSIQVTDKEMSKAGIKSHVSSPNFTFRPVIKSSTLCVLLMILFCVSFSFT